MSAVNPVAGRPAWRGELLGGLSGAVVTLGVVLTLGLIGHAPLGAEAAASGVPASFASVCIGGLVHLLLDRTRTAVSGPSSPTALIVAAMLAQLTHEPSATLPALLACAGLASVGAGLVMWAFGLLRLGRLAQFVPQPVLAGFMNGVAVLIVLAQLPSLLGVESLAAVVAGGDWQPLGLLLGLATAASVWGIAARWPRAPAQLLGMGAGLAAWALAQAVWPQARLGLPIGPLPDTLPRPDLALELLVPETAAFVVAQARAIVLAALSIGIFGALESIVGAIAVDQQFGERRDMDRMLRALGVANVVAGMFGALPAVQLRARAMAIRWGGGRGRAAALVSIGGDALLLLLASPLLALLPRAVLAGVMLTVAVALADQWTRRLVMRHVGGERSSELRQSLLMVAVVAGLTVFAGFQWAIGIGLLLSAALFVRTMNRMLLRARRDASMAPSRRQWPPAQEAVLRPQRRRIAIHELDGALFFGSGQRLAAAAAALPPDTRALVLDCTRLGSVDASGTFALDQLARSLAARRIELLLAGVRADNALGRQLLAYGSSGGESARGWHPDVDRAVEAAERLLLEEAGCGNLPAAMPLEQTPLFAGLEPAQRERLRTAMPARTLNGGEWLFAQGDPADALYVVVSGSIAVIARAEPHGQATERRYAVVGAGMLLGETAMLDGGGRSAGAVAQEGATVHVLTAQALQQLTHDEPLLAVRLYRNLATLLAVRLREATAVR